MVRLNRSLLDYHSVIAKQINNRRSIPKSMRPFKSVTFSLLGVAIGIFGLSVSIGGLALTQLYPNGVNIGIVVGTIIALVGVIVALAALSVKE